MSEAQLADYARRHRDALNLLVHLVTVPLFVIGVGVAMAAVVLQQMALIGVCVALVVYSLLMQRWGHRRERAGSPRERSTADAVFGFFFEQFVLFPHFVLSGQWRANWRAAQK